MTELTKDYGIAVGDRVKAHPNFDWDQFSGPADENDVGTVGQIIELPDDIREDGKTEGFIIVIWDSKPEETDEWDHTFGDLGGTAWVEDATRYGVVKVDG